MATQIVSSAARLPLVSRATFASSSRVTLRPFPVCATLESGSARFLVSCSPPVASQASLSMRQKGQIRLSLRSQSRHPSAAVRRNATTSSIPSSATHEQAVPIPMKPSIKVTPPSLEAIAEEGFLDDDVQLIPTNEAYLNITHDAVQQLVAITAKQKPEVLSEGQLALRVGVESGGCHGYQYTMALTKERGVEDYILQPEGLHSIPVVIDITSFGLLKGATLHFATELIGSSFRLQDNPQAKEGGACGCGVSWEAK